MTSNRESAAPRSEQADAQLGRRSVLIALLVALAVSICTVFLFFQSLGARVGKDFDTLATLELPSVVAFAVLLTAGRSRNRETGGVALAFSSAAYLTYYSFVIDAVARRATPDPSHPSILTEMQAVIGVVAASAAVMVCASLYSRRHRGLVLLCTVAVLGVFGLLRMIYR